MFVFKNHEKKSFSRAFLVHSGGGQETIIYLKVASGCVGRRIVKLPSVFGGKIDMFTQTNAKATRIYSGIYLLLCIYLPFELVRIVSRHPTQALGILK